MKKETINIIIRTLNEEKYLDKLLCGIESQRCSYQVGVTIVDSGSNDATLSIARQHNCNLMHINKKEFSFGKSLNIGCSHTISDYLVFISGHCVPVNGSWLERLIEPLRKGIVNYTYGKQMGGTETFWSEEKIFEKYFPDKSAIPQKGFYCNNANSAITYKTWKEFKFDENLTGLEDMKLAKELVKRGMKIGYVAEAKIYHYHNETWKQIKNRFERESFALKDICPEINLKKRDAISYFLKSVLFDIKSSFGNLNFNLKDIILYRFFQYYGSYKGNKMKNKLSLHTKESYFYPTLKKGKALEPVQNIEEDFSELSQNKVVALLPMKAHSERIPNKNFKQLNGKPLFRWVLDSLIEIDIIDLIVINTDARHILEEYSVFDSEKILIRDRPKKICGDFISMNQIIQDDVNNIKADTYLMTHTTNPLLSKSTITQALEKYNIFTEKGSYDSLFSVDLIQTRFYKEDATPINHNPDNLVRTQDLEPWFEENSNIYIFNRKSFFAKNSRIGLNPKLFVTPKMESIDIDNPEDWELSEALLKIRENKNNY
tara:strand:+ start:2612 stop:4243 length:1632 start_codon:yes stop_codon:yes gene_type:complete